MNFPTPFTLIDNVIDIVEIIEVMISTLQEKDKRRYLIGYKITFS